MPLAGSHSAPRHPHTLQSLAGGKVASDLESELVGAESVSAGIPQHDPGRDDDSVLSQTQVLLNPRSGSSEETRKILSGFITHSQPVRCHENETVSRRLEIHLDLREMRRTALLLMQHTHTADRVRRKPQRR